MIVTVAVPAGSKGILTGMILGVARISGESAPLLFTALNNQYWGGLREPTASLPVMIYKLAISPYEDWNRQAWAAGLVLITLVLLANIAARLVLARGVSVPRASRSYEHGTPRTLPIPKHFRGQRGRRCRRLFRHANTNTLGQS
jgi:hypothetical protein